MLSGILRPLIAQPSTPQVARRPAARMSRLGRGRLAAPSRPPPAAWGPALAPRRRLQVSAPAVEQTPRTYVVCQPCPDQRQASTRPPRGEPGRAFGSSARPPLHPDAGPAAGAAPEVSLKNGVAPQQTPGGTGRPPVARPSPLGPGEQRNGRAHGVCLPPAVSDSSSAWHCFAHPDSCSPAANPTNPAGGAARAAQPAPSGVAATPMASHASCSIMQTPGSAATTLAGPATGGQCSVRAGGGWHCVSGTAGPGAVQAQTGVARERPRGWGSCGVHS